MSNKRAAAAAGCACDSGNLLGVKQDFTTYTIFEQAGNPLVETVDYIRAINMNNVRKDTSTKHIPSISTLNWACHTSLYMSGGGNKPSFALIGASPSQFTPTQNPNFLGVRLDEARTYKRIRLLEKHAGSYNVGPALTIANLTWVHFRLRLDRTVGVNGTLYLQLFTDNTFATPVGGEISLTLNSVVSYVYWHGLSNYFLGTTRYWNGFVKDTWLKYGA